MNNHSDRRVISISDKRQKPLQLFYEPKPLLPLARYLNFKRALLTVAIAIAVNQFFQLGVQIHYGFFTETYPPRYYWIQEISAVIWYLFMTAWVILDIGEQGIRARDLFQLYWLPLRLHLGTFLKYTGITVVGVSFLTLLLPSSGLGLENLSTGQIALTVLNLSVLAPVCEELIFRGYLYPAMIPAFKHPRQRIVVNAMFFGAAHVFLVMFFIGASMPFYIFLIGFLLASLYEKSRSILPGILLHATNNTLVFLYEFYEIPKKIGIWS